MMDSNALGCVGCVGYLDQCTGTQRRSRSLWFILHALLLVDREKRHKPEFEPQFLNLNDTYKQDMMFSSTHEK